MSVHHTCWAAVDDDGVMERTPVKHLVEFEVEDARPIAGSTRWKLTTTRCDGTPLTVQVTATGRPTGLSAGRAFVAKVRPAPKPSPLLVPATGAVPAPRPPLARVAYPQVSLARGTGRTWVARCTHCPWEYTASRKADVELERDQHMHAHRTAKGVAS